MGDYQDDAETMKEHEMKKSNYVLILLAAVVWAGLQNVVDAAIVTFDSKAAFLVATGADSATGELPNLGRVGRDPIVVGNVTFQSASGFDLFIGTLGLSSATVANDDWTPLLPGNDMGLSGREHLDVALRLPTYSFGFDFVEPEPIPGDSLNINGPFVDSTFEVRLLDGAATVDTFTFNAPNNVAAFVGVLANTAFDNVEIRETVGHIGNEFFGQFYSDSADVPEPSTLAVFVGLAGFAILGRERRRANRDA